MQDISAYVGLDVHKATISVAVADAGRNEDGRSLAGKTTKAEAWLKKGVVQQHPYPTPGHRFRDKVTGCEQAWKIDPVIGVGLLGV